MTADDLRARPAYSDHGELPHVDVSPVERDALADLIESAEDAVRFEHSPSHMSALDDALAPFRREAKP